MKPKTKTPTRQEYPDEEIGKQSRLLYKQRMKTQTQKPLFDMGVNLSKEIIKQEIGKELCE